MAKNARSRMTSPLPEPHADSRAPLPLVLLGDAGLLEPAARIADVHAPEIRQLVDDLVATCAASKGVGIAAPQIGVGLRAFVVASRPSVRYPDAPEMEPLAMLNPSVTAYEDDGHVGGWEGCLSIPGLRGWVNRWQSVDVTWQNLEGAWCQQRFTGFVARIVQHELDHLDGVLFLHRVSGPADLAHEDAWTSHPRFELANAPERPSGPGATAVRDE